MKRIRKYITKSRYVYDGNAVFEKPIRVKACYAERIVNKRGRYARPSIWVPRNRHVMTGPFAGNLWNPKVTPYVSPVMDVAALPYIREVNVCKSPQTGFSTFLDSMMAWTSKYKPGPWLVVYPDRDTAKKNCRDRIKPMFQKSPALKPLLTSDPDDMTTLKLVLKTQTIHMAWSGSVTSLGNVSCMYIGLDETDKYDRGRKEAGPDKLAEKRATSFKFDRKIFKISTPTTEDGIIWTAFKNSHSIFVYQVQCPYCRQFHVMQFENIRWDDTRKISPEEMETENLAFYVCPKCGVEWGDTTVYEAVQAGRYVLGEIIDDQNMKVDAVKGNIELKKHVREVRPSSVGFHVPAWISRFVSLSEIAKAFLLYKRSGDLDDLKDFCNGYCAIPWKTVIDKPVSNRIYAAATDLPMQMIPKDAAALTMGVDSQLNGYWYTIRAWDINMTSWLIQWGFLASDDELANLISNTSWPAQDNKDLRYRISRVAIDTGGGKQNTTVSITERVYNFIRRMRQSGAVIYGVKGSSRALETKMKLGAPLDRTPSGKPIPGGLRILSLDTDKLKDLVHYRLNLAADGGGVQAAYLPADIKPDEVGRNHEYVRHITAEEKQRNTRGFESWVQIRKDNHLLDCEVYCHAAADPEWPGGGVQLLAYRGLHSRAAGGRRAISQPRVVKSKFMGG